MIGLSEFKRRTEPSVMLLEVIDENGNRKGSGTGFVITADGILLTCAHVVDKAERIRARLYNPGMMGGDTRWFECEILDPIQYDIDMALVKIENGGNFSPLPLRRTDEPAIEGEDMLLMGYPLPDKLDKDYSRVKSVLYRGTVSSIQKEGTVSEIHIVQCEGKRGQSGSPVFSCNDGRVIGVFDGSYVAGDENLKEEMNHYRPIKLFWERMVQE